MSSCDVERGPLAGSVIKMSKHWKQKHSCTLKAVRRNYNNMSCSLFSIYIETARESRSSSQPAWLAWMTLEERQKHRHVSFRASSPITCFIKSRTYVLCCLGISSDARHSRQLTSSFSTHPEFDISVSDEYAIPPSPTISRRRSRIQLRSASWASSPTKKLLELLYQQGKSAYRGGKFCR